MKTLQKIFKTHEEARKFLDKLSPCRDCGKILAAVYDRSCGGDFVGSYVDRCDPDFFPDCEDHCRCI